MSSLALLRPEPGIPAGALLAVTARSPRTTAAYRTAVSRFLAWCEAGNHERTAAAFAQYIAELRGRASASTVNRDLYGGKAAILQAAAAQGMSTRELAVMKTALDAIPALKAGQPEVRTISKDERAAIEAALSPRLAALTRFLYATACRISEALSVRYADIAQEGGAMARVRITGKGGKERHVRVPRSLLDTIDALYPAGREYLFVTITGGPLSRNYVTHEIERAARKAIGRTVSAHDYRHSRLTDLYRATGRTKAVSAYAGHANVSTTLAYYVQDVFTDAELEE